MKNKVRLILILTLLSIKVQAQRICYDSLELPPFVTLNDSLLTIRTSSSLNLENCKIKVSKSKEEIVLIFKKSKNKLIRGTYDYKYDLKHFKIPTISQYPVYWLNPDGNKVLLKLHHEKPYLKVPFFPFRNGDKWCYVDKDFNKLSDEFDFVYPFKDNYSVVKVNDKYALINKSLTLLTQPIFDDIDYQNYDMRNFRFKVKKGGKFYHIDSTGQIDYLYRDFAICGGVISTFQQIFTYRQNGKMGFLKSLDNDYYIGNPKLDTATQAIFDEIIPLTEEHISTIFIVKLNEKYGIYKNTGEELLPIIYDEIRFRHYKSQGYNPYQGMLVCADSKCGFVKQFKGQIQIITPVKYADAKAFNLGFSLVQTSDGKWGYIDLEGREYWKEK